MVPILMLNVILVCYLIHNECHAFKVLRAKSMNIQRRSLTFERENECELIVLPWITKDLVLLNTPLQLRVFINIPYISQKNRSSSDTKTNMFWPLYCIVLYWVVLMGWSFPPKALRPFQIYCAPPNLDIRTWMYLLNFAQRPIF